MTSHLGFVWPRSGRVECPDWDPTPKCGHGLHGLLRGEGNGNLVCWDSGAIWVAAWIDAGLAIDLTGKVKFPWAEVALVGSRLEVTAFLVANGCSGAVVGSTLTGGDSSTLTGGDGSTLTGGDGSTLTGGDRSTLTGGYGSTLTGGYGSTLTGGDGSTLTGGGRSALTGGYRSTLTGGYGSTLTGGDGSTLTGGYETTLTFRYWARSRYRTASFEVGGNGLKPDTAYRCDDKGNINEVAK